MLDVWKRQIDGQLAKSEEVYKKAKEIAATGKRSGTEQLAIQRLLDDADYNIRIVKLGHGVHNVDYATALLSAAQEWCKQVKPAPETATARTNP